MRTFLLLFSAVIALVLLPSARADTFEQFTATGTFLNEPFLALTGGFVVDETTGQVVSVDFFYGTTELSLLGNTGIIPGVPDAFDIDSFDPLGDELRLFLAAPGNGGSLAGYAGGPLCGEFADNPACQASLGGSFIGSNFQSHLGVGFDFIDDLSTGSIAPTPTPEAGTLTLLITGLACLWIVGRHTHFQ